MIQTMLMAVQTFDSIVEFVDATNLESSCDTAPSNGKRKRSRSRQSQKRIANRSQTTVPEVSEGEEASYMPDE